MLLYDQHPHNKSLVVALLGHPNAGKSTLINALLGQELAAVTPLPQTTRQQYHCVFTIDRTEIVLVDTPGLHRSNKEFNKRMNQEVLYALEGADLILLMLDSSSLSHPTYGPSVTQDLTAAMREFAWPKGTPVWVIMTKLDTLLPHQHLANQQDMNRCREQFAGQIEYWKKLFSEFGHPLEKSFLLSAKTEDHLHELTGALIDAAKSGAHLYPQGDLSNKNMRFFVSEYIREQAFLLVKEELPYELMVTVEDYFESKHPQTKVVAKINATIHVNRPSQRAIVIGTSGQIIKEIGSRARAKIEAFLGGQIFLNLHVKVSPKWFNNNFLLEEIGLKRATNSHRVWRQR